MDESEAKVYHIIPMLPHSVSEETVGVLPFIHHGWGKGGLKGEAETSLNSFIQAGSLSAVFDYIVSQCAYRLYLYLYCIAGIHRANATGGAGSDNITRQQGHYMRYEVYQFRNGVDKVVGVGVLLEFPV